MSGAADEGGETLSTAQKWLFSAAYVGAWGPLSVWNLCRTTLFIVYYQADVTAMGLIQTVAAFVDAFNGPFVAHMADSGALNRFLPGCFPLGSWGRRAPLMLLGCPLMMAGPTLMWLLPSRDLAGGWYAMCFFLFVNGNTVTLQSYLASIQEIFGNGRERALAVVRQTPFTVITGAAAGGVMLLAFTVNPDLGDRCCVTAGYDCLDAPTPPCGCFAAPAAGMDAAGAGAGVDGPTGYDAAFLSVCGASLPANQSAAGIAASRDAACSLPGIDRPRFGVCAFFTALLGLLLCGAVPPSRQAARLSAARAGVRRLGGGAPVAVHPSSTAEAAGGADAAGSSKALAASPPLPSSSSSSCPPLLGPHGLLSALCLTLRAPAFRVYACMMLLSITFQNFFTGNLNLYLIYLAGVEPKQIGGLNTLVAIANVCARVGCLPLFTRLLLHSPKHAHPARLVAYMKVLEAVCIPLLMLLLRSRSIDLTAVLVLGGIVTGVCASPFDMCQHMLIGWTIDEDALASSNGKGKGRRREGMHYAANGMVQHLTGAINGLILVAWGAAGFDSKLCVHEQPESARRAIDLSFVIGLPLLSILTAAIVWLYPIQGERLRRLQAIMGAAEEEK